VEELRQARRVVWQMSAPAGAPVLDPEAEQRRQAREAYLKNDLPGACRHWLAQPEPPLAYADRLLTAECLAETGDPRAPQYAGLLRAIEPVDADLALAFWHESGDRTAEAARSLVAAFERARRDPWPYPPLLNRSLQLAFQIASRDVSTAAGLEAALARPFAVGLADQERLRLRLDLAVLLAPERCVETLKPFEPHPPWEGRFLAQRARCYRETKHPLARRALDDLEDYLEEAPPKLETGLPAPGPPSTAAAARER
jgi:hypothetical protein